MAELRIGDRDRESAVAALGEHYAQGRLTKDEYDERSDAAWTARTAADLRPLFADLPAARPTHAAQPAPVAPPPRRQVPWKLLLVALAVLGVVTNIKLVLLAAVLWFVLSRHRVVGPPPWSGSYPPPPWGHQGHRAHHRGGRGR